MNFVVDLSGRVRNINLPKSKPLLPVFEAVVNSIQSIEDSFQKKGLITIKIIRRNEQLSLISENGLAPIESFEIIDNGVGFNNVNYNSFLTSDSTLKIDRGSKGLGRFTWLIAFSRVEIDSIYQENEHWFQKSFEFNKNSGISSLCEKKFEENLDIRTHHTVVRLINYQSPYYATCPQKTEIIAKRIIEHCIVYFILNNAPDIEIIDGEKTVNLNQYFSEYLQAFEEVREFSIMENTFYLKGIKFYGAQSSEHKVIYCANQRGVSEEKLSRLIPNLYENAKIKDLDDNYFTYLACIYGEYFDQNVNSARTEFNIPNSKEAIFADDDQIIDFETIKNCYLPLINQDLNFFLSEVEEEKQSYIRDFIYQEAPEYRSLIKYVPEKLESIKPNITKSKLELELHKIMNDYEAELKEKKEQILKTPREHFERYPEYSERYHQFLEQYNDIGVARLAKYVAHRKTIIELFENNLRIDENGKYSLEKNIHEIVFPMSATSDENNIFQKQNLWMIDEKLSFHEYLASDISFRTQGNSNLEDLQRPDLVIFNQPIAFTEGDSQPYSSIVIIEFKRPERDDYTAAENPIDQVLEYVEKLRSGKYKNKHGRTISLHENTPFYAYIICDITPKLNQFAKKYSYTQSSDLQGYFGYNEPFKTYVEIISLNKLVNDAKKRNHVLFKNLGL